MSTLNTPVLIVGAGPAGTAASLFLSQRKIPHIILDKSSFPRDKICGDGLTIEVMHHLKLLNPDYLRELSETAEFLPSWGAKAIAPNGREMFLEFEENNLPYAPFYTSKRLNFDEFLLSKLSGEYVQVFLETEVKSLERREGKIYVKAERKGGEAAGIITLEKDSGEIFHEVIGDYHRLSSRCVKFHAD